jgi:hypothetical protein
LAVGFGFLPDGFARLGLDDTGIGRPAFEGSLATGASECPVGLLIERGGLAGQGGLEHGLGEDGADVEEEVFDLGEGSTPGRPLGAVDLVDEVFGDPLQVRSNFIHEGGWLLGSRHLAFLSGVAPIGWIHFLHPV